MPRRRLADRIFDTGLVAFFVLLAVVMLLPLWTVLMTSLVDTGEYFARSLILWPRRLYLDSYRYIFTAGSEIFTSLLVTAALTVVGSLYSMLVTTSLAYGLSKRALPGGRFFIMVVTVTMFFSGGLIPYYLLIKNLGLMNTFAVLFIPSAVNTWNFLVIKSFFSQLPAELEESARMDGASDIRVFFRIVLPLSLPVLATFMLFYAVSYWNTWWPTTLFIQKKDLFTLQYVLRGMIVENRRPMMMDAKARQAGMIGDRLFDEGIKMATVIVATVPILCVYPFLQKYFAKGVMIGAVKG
jgi:ABC-type glycerol-3-phosphate transport system permease component